MEKIFLDTSFLIAYHNRKDENHEKVARWVRNIRKERISFLISDYIFDEVLTVLLVRGSKELSIEAGRRILESDRIILIRVDDIVFDRAWEIYQNYSDKNWSFTDCTSYVLMKGLNILKGVSFDEHFRQFGFEIVI